MFPYKTVIQINKHSDTPVYVQIANVLAREIRNGLLKPGTKLPGARSLATLLSLNRNTVIATYDELRLQGYIELQPQRGAFVSSRIPDIKAKPIEGKERTVRYPESAGYAIDKNILTPTIKPLSKRYLEFNDGLPDERIAPLDDLARTYRSLYKRKNRSQFSYSDPEGNPLLRETLSSYLNETRGFQTTAENILITRGTQMGIYLIAQQLCKKGDTIIVGNTSYFAADMAFQYAGAHLQRVKIDTLGIDTEAIEKICKKKKIRAVYVTPHHHFPTTVMLSACRRMNLLRLAEKYGFMLIEDDYDYDFHYASSPILPMASVDNHGMVINIGTMSKTFSPALRVAYVVAPKNIISALATLRFIIDRQGDYLLEQAIAELFKDGSIKRHLRKALLTYHARRDYLGKLLTTNLADDVRFTMPSGGLAIWTQFHKSISLPNVASRAAKKGLIINDGKIYNHGVDKLNATRLGFASLNFNELDKAVRILRDVIR